MNYLFSILLFVSTSLAMAQENVDSNTIDEDFIIERLNTINSNNMDMFIDEMEKLNRISQEYVKRKNEQCVSDKVLTEVAQDGEKIIKKVKVTKKEKKFCQLMLVNFRMRYTQLAFKGRKNYLRYIQKTQVKQLVEFEKKKLKQLEQLAKKYQ